MVRIPTRDAAIFDVPSVDGCRLSTEDVVEILDAQIDDAFVPDHSFPYEPTAYAATPLAFDAVDLAPLPRERSARASEQPLCGVDQSIDIDVESFDDFETSVTLVSKRLDSEY